MGRHKHDDTPQIVYEHRRAYYLANKKRYQKQQEGYRAHRRAQQLIEREERLAVKRNQLYGWHNPDRRRNATDFVRDFKRNNPCTDCGSTYPFYVMDLDHIRGTKLMDISRLVSRGASLSKLSTEIAKCDLVCANCHRIRTFVRLSNSS